MHLEHFTYGIENGEAYKLRMSKGVTRTLSDDKIKWLMHAGDNAKKETWMLKVFDKEEVVAYMLVKPAVDKYGRKGFWSHVVLFKLQDFFEHLAVWLGESGSKKEWLEPINYE